MGGQLPRMGPYSQWAARSGCGDGDAEVSWQEVKGEKVWVTGLGVYNLPTFGQPEKGPVLRESNLAMCMKTLMCVFILCINFAGPWCLNIWSNMILDISVQVCFG